MQKYRLHFRLYSKMQGNPNGALQKSTRWLKEHERDDGTKLILEGNRTPNPIRIIKTEEAIIARNIPKLYE